MKPLLVLTMFVSLTLTGCASGSFLPDKSPTKLEKSPCACDGERAGRHA